MTRPLPVTAYAAVSPDDNAIVPEQITRNKGIAMVHAFLRRPEQPRSVIPVTIIPTEQYEAMVASLGELVAAMRRYEGDVAGDADQPTEHREMMERAEGILSALKEQGHG